MKHVSFVYFECECEMRYLVLGLAAMSLATLVRVSAENSFAIAAPKGALFYETFQGNWKSTWSVSDDEDYEGQWVLDTASSAPGFEDDKALTVNSVAKKHAIAAAFSETVDNKEKDFVVQYEVRFSNRLECGGAYLKLVRDTGDFFSGEEFNSKTDYVVMFGPDKCGSTNKVHFILKHRNPISGKFEEKHLNKAPSVTVDTLTHLYTLIIRKDNSFEIFIDQKSVRHGNLLEDFDPPVNPPATIDDPTDSKPADWVDEAQIPDPSASKPEDWDENAPRTIQDPNAKKPAGWLDDAPEQIHDPEAVKPEDWDDELDGEYEPPLVANPECQKVGCGVWEAPMIKNPAYKGKWSAPLINNPVYKGEWKARQVPNPEYFVDEAPHNLSPMSGIGFELWTMQNGIQFDNIYVGYDGKAALSWSEQTWSLKHKAEEAKLKAEEKKLKEEKLAEQKESGIMGMFEAYSQVAGEFVAEYPLPVFFTIVGLLIGLVVFLEYRRPRDEEVEEDESLSPQEAKELLDKLQAKLEKKGEEETEGEGGAENAVEKDLTSKKNE